MTHHELDSTTLKEVLRLLADNGLGGSGRALEILMNAATRLERGEFLKAQPYERSDERIVMPMGSNRRRCRPATAS